MAKGLTLVSLACVAFLMYGVYAQSSAPAGDKGPQTGLFSPLWDGLAAGYKVPGEIAESAYTVISRSQIKNDILKNYTENKSFLARFNDYRKAASSSAMVVIPFDDESQIFFDVNLVFDSSSWFPSIQFEAEKIVDAHNNSVVFDEVGSPEIGHRVFRFPENAASMPKFLAAADLIGADITARTCSAGQCTLTITD
jgi:hypothetical protein